MRESVSTVGQLIAALDRLKPGIARELDDPLYNIAVNDEILLHAVDSREVKDGDVVKLTHQSKTSYDGVRDIPT